MMIMTLYFFFFQAEDGIRDWSVTGVQTCALPISSRDAEPPREGLHQLEDLRLDRDVERRGGLVGEDQRRIARERHGDHHSLAHPSRELMRVLPEPSLGVRDPDHRQELRCPTSRLPWRHPEVDLEPLRELAPDG